MFSLTHTKECIAWTLWFMATPSCCKLTVLLLTLNITVEAMHLGEHGTRIGSHQRKREFVPAIEEDKLPKVSLIFYIAQFPLWIPSLHTHPLPPPHTPPTHTPPHTISDSVHYFVSIKFNLYDQNQLISKSPVLWPCSGALSMLSFNVKA